MKLKALLLTGLALAATGMTSCNLDNDEENNYVNSQYRCCNLVLPTNGTPFATRASYYVTFYYTNGTASLSTSDLSLGYNTTGFTTNNMESETKKYTYNKQELDVTSFSGGFSNSNGLTVQNLKGFLSAIVNILSTNDPVNPMYPFSPQIPIVMSYDVNNEYTVKTFMPDAIYTGTTTIATVGSPMAPFTNDGVRYRVVFSTDLKKADIIFYSAKFAEAMPGINFVLQNLDVTFNNNGYIISGENLTPSLYESDGLTPAPQYQVTKFEFINTSDNLTSGSAIYTVKIGEALFNGDFQGFYTLSSTN